MNKAFIQGFIYKCAQNNIDPEKLLKYAAGTYSYETVGPDGKPMTVTRTATGGQNYTSYVDRTGGNTVAPIHTKQQVLNASRRFSESPNRAQAGVSRAPYSGSYAGVPRRLTPSTTRTPGVNPAPQPTVGFRGRSSVTAPRSGLGGARFNTQVRG